MMTVMGTRFRVRRFALLHEEKIDMTPGIHYRKDLGKINKNRLIHLPHQYVML